MEMLLVSALLPIIFFVIFANMSSGMRAWKSLNQPVSEEGTIIFLDQIRNDFSNTFLYTPIPFIGDSTSLSFAGTVPSDKALGGDRGIGRLGYHLDDSKHMIMRDESNFSEVFKDAKPRERAMLEGVTRLSIEYLTYIPADLAFSWKGSWQPGKKPIPAAVRLTIERSAGENLVKTFLVPGGN